MKEIIHCEKCNRPILEHEVNNSENIVYCYGCNYYFPIEKKSNRNRNETVIPNGTNYIRYRILKDELEISLNWFRNYRLAHVILYSSSNEMIKTASILAFFFNRTKIQVNKNYIRIEHRPVDLIPMVFYNAGYVKQLFVKKINQDFWIKQPTYNLAYGLYALLENGKEELWIWNLNKKTLLFIEQEIERTLGLPDIKMKNEVIH